MIRHIVLMNSKLCVFTDTLMRLIISEVYLVCGPHTCEVPVHNLDPANSVIITPIITVVHVAGVTDPNPRIKGATMAKIPTMPVTQYSQFSLRLSNPSHADAIITTRPIMILVQSAA